MLAVRTIVVNQHAQVKVLIERESDEQAVCANSIATIVKSIHGLRKHTAKVQEELRVYTARFDKLAYVAPLAKNNLVRRD